MESTSYLEDSTTIMEEIDWIPGERSRSMGRVPAEVNWSLNHVSLRISSC